MKIVVDTNIIKYLARLSKTDKFDVGKLEATLNNSHYQKGITIFSLIEILQHHYSSNVKQQINVRILLTYLKNNHFDLVADKKIPIDFKNAFERCLNDEKQIDYFYDNITPFLVDYDTTILTNLTLYLGFIFAVLVYKYDKSQKNDQTLIDNFCYWLIQVIKLIKDTYSESYHKAFKQSYNKQNFTTFNTQIIKDILNDALCFFYSYYKIYTSGHIPQIVDIVPLVQEAKKKKIDTIHYRKLFKTGINDRHIDKCVDIFYDKYSPQHDTPAIDRIYKEIIKLMLKNRKTEFNDFIDILNFVMPAQLCIAEKGTIYFTNEDKWNDIIKLNKSDNDFFENCFNFHKSITE